MKMRYSVQCYCRTILLSILAACTIESLVNADELRMAFMAGRKPKVESNAWEHTSAGPSWLRLPQQVSRLAGRVYHLALE